MRIALDYVPAVEQVAGIGRFTRDLTGAVVDEDSQHEFVLLGPAGSTAPQWVGTHPRVRWATLPFSRRVMGGLWHRLHLPLPVEWMTGTVDLFHATDYVAPHCRQADKVVTVHDLSFLRHPEYAEPRLARFLSRTVPGAVRSATRVLADSEFSRREVISVLNVPPDRVDVVYGGVSPVFGPPRDPQREQEVASRYGLAGPFVLFVARLEPRKNLASLLKAFSILVQRKTAPGPLVIGGGRGWLHHPVEQLVAELRLEEHVRFLGHVPDQDLPALLAAASVFVFPSHYEGFGLPPLEAMACGTAVIASDAASLPEVLGDAALFVPPMDIEGLAGAILRVTGDTGLRDDLRARGLDRAARFTWQASARQLLAAYEKAVLA